MAPIRRKFNYKNGSLCQRTHHMILRNHFNGKQTRNFVKPVLGELDRIMKRRIKRSSLFTTKFIKVTNIGNVGQEYLKMLGPPQQSFQRKIGFNNGSFIKRQWKTGDFYSQMQLIGKGGFGNVYQAYCVPSKYNCVLKYISLMKLRKKNMPLSEILLESVIQKSANHPNIIHGWGEIITTGHCVIIMEHLELGDLAHFLKRSKPIQTPHHLDWQAKIFTRQIVSAVKYLQSKLDFIHMDLKPANIMISGRYRIKVADFGCSVRMISYRKLHSYEEWKGGTTAYCPPEILKHPFSKFDSTVDVWSIGCIVYSLLTNCIPFFDTTNTGGKDEETYVENALKRMKVVRAGQWSFSSDSFFEKLRDNPSAIKFLRQIFVLRQKRPLVSALGHMEWLKSNYR